MTDQYPMPGAFSLRDMSADEWTNRFIYGNAPWGNIAHDLACLLTISDPTIRKECIDIRLAADDANSVGQ